MHRAEVVWLLAAGCTVGAPAGFSSGEQWTFPLVGPLEDGVLLTPATVRGHGPYLFAIDPDANVTALDQQVVEEAQLRGGVGPHRIDETDTGRVRFYAEMLDLRVGNLTVGRRDAMVFPTGFYDTEGRRISGILGRDVIPDSLVFGFDRDQGVAVLATTRSFQAPPDAIAVHYETIVENSTFITGMQPQGRAIAVGDGENRGPVVDTPYNDVPGRLNGSERTGVRQSDIIPVQRRLATARIGRARFAMHLDLGAAVSQLRETKWRAAKLSQTPIKVRVTDEAVTAREVTMAGTGAEVTLGGARSAHATFVPYVENRFVVESVDGSLGLDFFQPYAVYADWHKGTYYLKPRGAAADATPARLARWGTALPPCAHPGCVTAELVSRGGRVTLNVVRDPEAANRALEVLLHPTAARGKPPGSVVPLVVQLPAATSTLTSAMPRSYAGATIAVVDVSPFPRQCVDANGCVLPLGAPTATEDDPEDAPGPIATGPVSEASPDDAMLVQTLASPGDPKTVPTSKLQRRSGAAEISPDAAVQHAVAGQPLGGAIIKVCLTSAGKVDFTRLVKSSGATAYDRQLQDAIEATWAFSPVQLDGQPQPVCATFTFKP